jgi:hypothetical protein
MSLFERAEFCDHFDVGYMMLTLDSSIASSRKRKFAEYLTVAPDPESAATINFHDADALFPNAVDFWPALDTESLQYVCALMPFYFRDERVASCLVLPIHDAYRTLQKPVIH